MQQDQAVRRSAKTAVAVGVSLLLLTARPPVVAAQFIAPEDRAILGDFSYVTAIAATHSLLYAATPGALVTYDRHTLRWRETVSVLDGYPAGGAVAMVANPHDDTVWFATAGQWFMYRPFGRSFESGPLPGRAITVALDAEDPARGAWFQTGAGWYLVERGGFVRAAPPPPRRIAPLSRTELRRVAPAFESALMRVTRDEQLRPFDLTAAAASPLGDAVYLATSGNGAFRLDPVGYGTDRLPPGLMASGAGSIALVGDRVCVGTDLTLRSPGTVPAGARRGVTCVRADFSEPAAFEAPGLVAVGGRVRAVAPAARGALWAASEEGLTRFGAGRPVRLTTAHGLPSHDVRALAPDSGGVWAGTSHGIAFVTDGDRPVVADAVNIGTAVGSLLVHGDTLWVGSSLGLVALPRGATGPTPVAGHQALRQLVRDLAALHDTLVAATDSRVLWRIGGAWADAGLDAPGVGRIAAVAGGPRGLWVAGAAGIAFLPSRGGAWVVFGSPRDVPQPVRDIAVDERWVWLATPAGLVRLDRRAIER